MFNRKAPLFFFDAAALVFADFSGFATLNSTRISWGSPMSTAPHMPRFGDK